MKNDIPVTSKNITLLAKIIIWYFKFMAVSFLFGLFLCILYFTKIVSFGLFFVLLPLWFPISVLLGIGALFIIGALFQIFIKKIRKKI